MRIVILSIMYLYSLLLLLFLTFIFPFIKIKIGSIHTRTIGDGSIAHEIFYYEIKEKIYKKNNEIYIWFNEKKVANNFLLNKFKQKFLVLPGFLLYYPFTIIKKYNLNYLLAPIENKKYRLKDNYKVLRKNPRLINFEKSETDYAKRICKVLKIEEDDKIICASARTPNFKNENFICPQNANIKTYFKGFDYLIENDYKIILMGDSYENLPKKINKNIICYSNSEFKSDMLDIYFISRAEFIIQSPSGIGEIASMMRVPRLIVNFWGLETLVTYEEDYVPLIIPKKVFYKENKKQINFSKLIEKKLGVLRTNEDVEKVGFFIEDNSPDEILNGVIEMKKKVGSKNFETNNHQLFWNDYNKIFDKEGTKKISIVDKFYKDNIKFFEQPYV